jgi:hypothetical protein
MIFGLEIDGFSFNYGCFSVIQKGSLSATVTITKANHPDISIWNVFFVPVGVRDTSKNELRPTWAETTTTITMTPPSTGISYIYFVLGR